MKKIVAIACTVLMMATLSGCGEDYSNTTVVGQVAAIDGTKVTLQLGEMAELELPEGMEDMFGGEMPEMPQWGSGEIPKSSTEDSGDLQWGTQDGGGMPQWGSDEVPEGGMPKMPNGENGEMPEWGVGEMPEGFGGRGGMMPGAMVNFIAGEETLTVDLENVEISFGFGQMTMEGDISMISEGSILVIEYGDNNKILSVTVQGGGNRENMDMPKGNGIGQPYS